MDIFKFIEKDRQGSFEKRAFLSMFAFIIYLIAFLVINQIFSITLLGLAAFPILITAILFRQWGGTISALSSFPLNTFLLLMTDGQTNFQLSNNFFILHLILILFGLILDYLINLTLKYKKLKPLQDKVNKILLQSENTYKGIIDSFNEAVYIQDEEGHFLFVNRGAEEMYGYHRDEMLGKTPEFLSAEGKNNLVEVAEKMEKAFNGEAQRFNFWGLKKDGRTFLKEVRVYPGEYYGKAVIIAIAEDITDRVQAEEALRESEKKYRNIFEHAEDVIYQTDFKGNISGISPSIERRGGYKPEEVIGKQVTDFYPYPEEYKALDDMLNEHGMVNDFEIHLKYRNGKIGVTSVTAHIVFDEEGTPVGTEGVLRDISKRIETETKLRESEARYRIVTQNAAQAIITSDQRGLIESWNPSAEKMFGYTKDEALGQPISLIMPQRYHGLHNRGLEEMVQTKRPLNNPGLILEHEGKRKDGSIFPIEISLSTWELEGKTFFGTIIHDITSRVEAREQLKSKLFFSNAVNKISDVIITQSDPNELLSQVAQVLGETLKVDRSLIYDVDFEKEVLIGLCEWLNPALPDILPTIGTYPINLFIGAITHFKETRQCFESHHDDRSPHLVKDGSAEVLHGQMNIKSGFWFPFGFQENGFYILVFNQVSHKRDWSEEERAFINDATKQVNIALQKMALVEGDFQAKEEITKLHTDLQAAYEDTLAGWARALELRDHETQGHSRRVIELTMKMAKAIGIEEEDLIHIRHGALLHDIGKFGIPDNILLKKGELTEEEWDIMKLHPQYARDFLSSIQYLRPALDIPYCHHEHWDGSGYPQGLKGEEIPIAAQIFAVVDVWDALLHDRPYRNGWSKEKIISYIRERKGKKFAPKAVDTFFEIIASEESLQN